MAANVVIQNVHPELDGTYDWDDSGMTSLELHAVLMFTGCTPEEMEAEGAYGSAIGLALVVLMREGKITGNPRHPWKSPEADLLWQAAAGSVQHDREADALPPVTNGSGPNSSVLPASGADSSGESSVESSESPADVPSPTGAPI